MLRNVQHKLGRHIALASAIGFVSLTSFLPSPSAAGELAMPPAAPCNCTSKEREKELKAKMKSTETHFGSHSSQYIQSLLDLADLYAHRGNILIADALLKEAEDDCVGIRRLDELATEVEIQRSRLAIDEHDYPHAERYAREAIEIPTKSNKQHGRALATLALAQAEQKRFAEAQKTYDESWKYLTASGKTADEEAAMQLLQMGSLAERLGQQQKEIQYLEESLAVLGKAQNPNHPHADFVREQLANAYLKSHSYDRAASLLKTVIANKEAIFGSDSAQLLGPLYQYSVALEKLGKSKESAAAKAHALSISVNLQKKAQKSAK